MPNAPRKIEVVRACDCEDLPPVCESCVWEVLGRTGRTLTSHKTWREAMDSATTRALLDAYAARTCRHPNVKLHEAELPIEDYAPEAIAALRAVLDLHATDRSNGPDPDGRCFECAEVAPCPTVRAITTAIQGDQQ